MGRKTKTNIMLSVQARLRVILSAAMLCFAFALPAAATYLPFNTSTNMNVGIGTAAQQAAFVVTNGNVGIGTWTAKGGNLIVNGGGNVGLGSAWPGQLLDVQGTVRMTGLTLTGNGAASGNVLVTNGVGVGTWMVPSTLSISGGTSSNYWLNTAAAGNVGLSTTNTVGIGTTSAGVGAGLVVMNGNVGIGTFAPTNTVQVYGPTIELVGQTMQVERADNTLDQAFILSQTSGWDWQIYQKANTNDLRIWSENGARDLMYFSSGTGNVGVSTISPGSSFSILGSLSLGSYATNTAPIGGIIVSGNVGIGSANPGQMLDVQGTARVLGENINGGNLGIGTWPSNYLLSINTGAAFWSRAVPTTMRLYDTGYGVPTADNTASNGDKIVLWNSTLPGGGSGLKEAIGADAYGVTIQASGVNDAHVGIWTAPGPSGTAPIERVRVISTGNVGLGTVSPNSLLAVLGNVAIASASGDAFLTNTAPNGGMIVEGNVGIGSANPGQALDVQGTARMTGLTLTGNGAASGNIMVSNGVGVGTWMAPGTLGASGASSSNYWTLNGGAGNVGINTSYAVGIGTSFVGGTGEATFSVMNGNVGIGTWVPSALLSINGITQSTGDIIVSSNASFNGFALYNNIGGQLQALLAGNDGGNNGGTLYLSSAATSTTIISGSPNQASYFNNGKNVGIGTTVPGSTLSVAGGVGIGTGFNSLYVNTAAPNGGMIVQGNVGIGSLVPGQALDVQGTVRTTGLTLTGNGAASGNVLVTNGVGVGTWMAPSTLSTSGGTASNYWLNDTGNVGINTAYSVGIGTISAVNTLNVLGGIGIGTFSYDPYMKTIAPNGGMIISGNVGIGTWAPSQNLYVNGSMAINSTIYSTNGLADLALQSNNAFITSANIYLTSYSDSPAAINLVGAVSIGTINFQNVLPQGALIVEPGSGNVGIGTWTALNSTLAMAGNLGIGTNLNSPYLSTAGPAGGAIIQGNVGIGSLSPGQALDVNGTVRMTGLTLTGNGAANGNVLVTNGVGVGTWMPASTLGSTGGSNYWLLTAGAGNVGLSTTNTVGIGTTTGAAGAGLIVMNGNVGVGSTAPGATVDVQGNIRVSNGAAFNVFTTNVGIYSTNPGAALDVQGMVRTTAFTLNNSPAAGDILMTNAVGVGTWIPASAVASGGSIASNYWTLNGGAGNVGINTSYAVGIGTSFVGGTGEATFSVMNGNVGIGTWVPSSALVVNGNVGVGVGPVTANGPLQIRAGTDENGFFQSNQNLADGIAFSSVNDLNSANKGLELRGSTVQLSSIGANPIYFLTNDALNSEATIRETIDKNGNIGIGTYGSGGVLNQKLTVVGNIGVGISGPPADLFTNTAPPNGGMIIESNVGIGSWAPGQILDVQGTIRTTGVTLSGNGAANGNVLVGNSIGVGTWMPASTLGVSGGSIASNYWALNGGAGNVGINTSYAVGIGTAFVGGTGEAALSVMNGNVGIGTWVPVNSLDVNGGGAFGSYAGQKVLGSGNVGISGNLGIGTWLPSSRLQIMGGPQASGASQFFNYDWENGTAGTFLGTSLQQQLQAAANSSAQFTALNVYSSVNNNVNYTGEIFALQEQFFDQGTGTLSNVYGGQYNIENTTTGTISSAIAGVFSVTNLSTGAVTNAYGVASVNVQGGTNGYGVYVSGVTGATNNYDYYGLDSTAKNYFAGNVGIGSLAPSQTLDVTGTARMTGLTLTGNGAANGNVLVGNSIGVGTWMPASTLGVSGGAGTNYWLLNGGAGNVGINTSYAVGIGTAFVGGTGEAALSVMRGNVGIGTWLPHVQLDVEGTLSTAYFAGNVGIGTWIPNYNLDVYAKGQAFDIMEVGDQSGTYFAVSGALGMLGIRADNIGALNSLTTNIINGPASGSPGTEFFHESADDTYTSGTGQLVLLFADTNDGQFQPTSGNGVYNMLEVDPNIDQTGTAVGITRAVFINPNNPAAHDFRALEIAVGNVGIGTISGNLGIGSQWPGQRLDINGTARMGGFTLTGNGAANGNVLVGNSIGVGTWMPASTLGVSGGAGTNYWLLNGGAGNVGINTSYAVGIGTAFVGGTGEAAFSVMNGNVGIGTWVPATPFQINGSSQNIYIAPSGNLGIGTTTPSSNIGFKGSGGSGTIGVEQGVTTGQALTITAGAANTSAVDTLGGYLILSGGSAQGTRFSGIRFLTAVGGASGSTTNTPTETMRIENGNVGIGTITTSNPVGLSVLGGASFGSYATTAAPAGGIIASGNVGIGSSAPGQLLDVQGTVRDIGEIVNGNVGIGTYKENAGLSVMNGNVGIGTWSPRATLDVEGALSTVSFAGNVGIGTLVASNLLTVNGNMVANGSILTNPNGSTTAAPRSFGFSPAFTAGQAAQIQFGDTSNTLQNGYGDRMQLSAYWGIEIRGDSETTAPAFIAGTAADPSVTIFAPSTATSNTLSLVSNGTGTTTYDVFGSTGNLGIGTTTPQGSLVVTNGNVGIGTFAPTNGFVYNNCAAHSGQAACWTTHGAAGYCTTVVSAAGACTCTAC